MIPCFICGQNAETGWIEGFPPAPDSQKLGLCPRHNTRENRRKAKEAWQNFMRSSIGAHTRNEAFKTAGSPRILNIFFLGGGSISVPCLDFGTPDPDLLKITTPEGEAVFFPLRQVLRYSLAPVPPAEQDRYTFERTSADTDGSPASGVKSGATADTVDAEILPNGALPPGALRALAAGSGNSAPGKGPLGELPPADFDSALRKLPPKVFSAGHVPSGGLSLERDPALQSREEQESLEANLLLPAGDERPEEGTPSKVQAELEVSEEPAEAMVQEPELPVISPEGPVAEESFKAEEDAPADDADKEENTQKPLESS